MTNRQDVLSAWTTAARYRTVDEDLVVDGLMLSGWAAELHAGAGAGATIRRQAKAVLDRFVTLGLPFEVLANRRSFDPVEVFGFSKFLGCAGEDRFWEDICVRSDRARYRRLAAVPLPARVTVDLRRTFNIASASNARPARLRFPLPIAGGGLGGLRVEVLDDGGLPWRRDASGQRLEAKAMGPSRLTASVRYTFTTTGDVDAAPEDNLDVYLARSEGYVQVTAAIERLAAHLSHGAVDRSATVSRFWDFMMDEMVSCPVHHDQVLSSGCATDWVVGHRRFDCHVGSAFLVALCRAEGIPARIVTGYLLRPDFSTAHSWTEIWLGRWLPFDLLSWDLSAAGRDAGWRGALAGQLEPRMPVQHLPLRFTGPVGVPLPPRWHLLEVRGRGGVEISFIDVESGALVYKDEVRATLRTDVL